MSEADRYLALGCEIEVGMTLSGGTLKQLHYVSNDSLIRVISNSESARKFVAILISMRLLKIDGWADIEFYLFGLIYNYEINSYINLLSEYMILYRNQSAIVYYTVIGRAKSMEDIRSLFNLFIKNDKVDYVRNDYNLHQIHLMSNDDEKFDMIKSFISDKST